MLEGRLTHLRGDFDYISTLNLMWAAEVLGDEWFDHLVGWACFDGGLTHFNVCAKAINDAVLTASSRHLLNNWTYYVGMACLSGYRNPPFPGFDVFDEADKLAHGGLKMYFPPGCSFADVAREVLLVPTKHVPYLSLRDFIVGASWLTSGASSVGKLEVSTWDEERQVWKKKNIKARKNFVVDTVELEELYNGCVSNDKQHSVTIVKSELGKIRLAVAGDIYTYLKMAWIGYLTGHSYLDWPGSSLNETPDQQLRRMERFLHDVAAKYGLPYDYYSFDHQPPTDELVDIAHILFELAQPNVDPSGLTEFFEICLNVENGFRESELTAREGDRSATYAVTGGLMSGLAWTSIIGNAWNTVKTSIAVQVLRRCGLDVSNMTSDVRGDDSAIFDSFVENVIMMNEAYKALGVVGGEGKFSVQEHGMEFLRVWYGNRCMGYPCRALPGLVQRKPWSNQPWEDMNVIKSIFEITTILKRRGCHVEQVWKSLRSTWCRLHSLPTSALSTPVALGGWGIEPWDGVSVCTPRIPKSGEKSIRVNPSTGWRQEQWRKKAEKYGISIPDDSLQQLALDELKNVVASDDVPDISSALRAEWRKLATKVRVRTSKTVVQVPAITTSAVYPQSVDAAILRRNAMQDSSGTFGSFAKIKADIEDVRALLKHTRVSLSSWLKENRTVFWHHLQRLRRHSHMSEAMDWLFGNLHYPLSQAHPLAKPFITAPITSWINRTGVRNIATRVAKVAPWFEQEFVTCPLNQYLLSW